VILYPSATGCLSGCCGGGVAPGIQLNRTFCIGSSAYWLPPPRRRMAPPAALPAGSAVVAHGDVTAEETAVEAALPRDPSTHLAFFLTHVF